MKGLTGPFSFQIAMATRTEGLTREIGEVSARARVP